MKSKANLRFLTVVGTIFLLSLAIYGCNGNSSNTSISECQTRVGRFGPNDDTEGFFAYTNGFDGQHVGNAISFFDIDTQVSQEIFHANEQENVYLLSDSPSGVIEFITENEDGELLYTYDTSSGLLEYEKYIESEDQNYDSSICKAEITTDDQGTIYFTKEIFDSKYYCTANDETFELNGVGGSAFNKSGIYTSDLISIDGTVYIRLTAIVGIGHGPQGIPYTNDSYNAQIKKDVLYSFDPKTRECNLIYDTNGDSERIVGYKEGVLYLFKNNALIQYDTNSKTTESIKKFDNGHKLIFYWYGNDLLVFDATDNVVLTVIYGC